MTETPLFIRTFDFITWLMPVTERFPKTQRFLVSKRLLDAALDFQEIIVEANHARGRGRAERLAKADAELDKVRLYLRLIFKWTWLSEGQYFHAAEQVSEIGKLLGGWRKQHNAKN